MSTSDDELAARVRARDPAALGELLERRRGALLALVERQLGAALRRKLEPEDILQEVGAEAVRSLPNVDFAGRDPFGWLCQLVERRIIDAHRRYYGAAKRNAAREAGLGPSGADASRAGLIDLLVVSMTTASQVLSRKHREARLLAALEQLPEGYREALRLRYVENLPSKEIAERMGKSDGAVRVMLTRALDKLQQLLGPAEEP